MQKFPILICILVLTSSIPVVIGDYSPQANVVTNERTHLTYSTIQAAVTAALSGDTLSVGAGTYTEHVSVSKKLNINGASSDTVIVDGAGTGDVFFITGDYVNITDMTITNDGGDTGIYLQNADYGFINGNLFQNNNGANGGIYFDASSHNTLTENNFNDSTVWAIMMPGDYNLIYHNNFFNCSAIDDVDSPPSTNNWNATYPTGGNYWYDHVDFTDVFSGPLQNIPGSDGFVDDAYTCGRSGTDFYPFMEPIDFTMLPPTLSNPSPTNDASGISINRTSVSITIEDSGIFSYTIEGEYLVSKSETGVTSGVKTTTLITPLPYYETVIWYVNATNGGSSVNGSYMFTTARAGNYDVVYVKQSYGPSDPQWRKDHWNDIQDAIDASNVGGTVYIYSGIYDVGIDKLDNLWINKSITLEGENKDTTIIHGEAEHNGVVDCTIEVSTVKYPWAPYPMADVTIRDLTIETETVGFFQSACLYFRSVSDSSVENCIIRGDSSGGYTGVTMDTSSNNITISNCYITGSLGQGILSLGKDILIAGNNISHCDLGLYNYVSERNLVTGNVFFNNMVAGALVMQSDATTIIENDFIRNGWDWGNPYMIDGVALHISVGVTNTRIYHNNFFNNAPMLVAPFSQVQDDTGCIWNSTYPVCGNYWSDLDNASENAFDRYTGPLQNATGPDGIVDFHSPQPYLIGGAAGATDFYPFIYPYVTVESLGVDFTWTPKYPKPGEKVSFSSDGRSDIVKWTWVFGDGKQSMSKKSTATTHIYTSAGFYTVTLTTQDTRGAAYPVSKKIYVGNGPHLFPPPPPKYPKGFTVPEMYMLLHAIDLPKSDEVVTVMVIDSGVTSRTYNNIDLSKITALAHPSFTKVTDENGHGTWVNYAVAYMLQTKLPNSKQISYKVFDVDGGSSTDAFMSAFNKAKELHPDIVSISAGIVGGSPDDPFAKACEELRREGIIVIVAAGNFGPNAGTIASPGVSDSVIAVAGSDPQWEDNSDPTLRETKILDLADDTICSWSSRGPVTGVANKPDITSPGESIKGPWLNSEKVVSGTSMATPLISGGAAVIVANNKGLINTVKSLYFWDKSVIPQAFEDAIEASAYTKGDANSWGAGIAQFDKINGNFQMGLYSKLIIWFSLPLILILIIIVLTYYYLRQRSSSGYSRKSYKVPKWIKKL